MRSPGGLQGTGGLPSLPVSAGQGSASCCLPWGGLGDGGCGLACAPSQNPPNKPVGKQK